MKPSADNPAPVNPAPTITSADVMAFIAAKRLELGPEASLHCYASSCLPNGYWLADIKVSGGTHHGASSAEESIAKAIASIPSPAAVAARKREQAMALLAEADKIDGENGLPASQPAEPAATTGEKEAA